MRSKEKNFIINEETKDFDEIKLNEIFNNNEKLNIKFKSIIEKMINSNPQKDIKTYQN